MAQKTQAVQDKKNTFLAVLSAASHHISCHNCTGLLAISTLRVPI